MKPPVEYTLLFHEGCDRPHTALKQIRDCAGRWVQESEVLKVGYIMQGQATYHRRLAGSNLALCKFENPLFGPPNCPDCEAIYLRAQSEMVEFTVSKQYKVHLPRWLEASLVEFDVSVDGLLEAIVDTTETRLGLYKRTGIGGYVEHVWEPIQPRTQAMMVATEWTCEEVEVRVEDE